jgi:tetratricopeptide (TPR) repeat protein
MSGYQVAHVDDLDSVPADEGLVWHPVRRRFGIGAFGINAYTAEHVGGHVVERHDETNLGHEEVYFVAAGHARFTLAGEEVDAPAGTFVYIGDPAVQREAVALADGTTVLAIGGKPGDAYTPSAWETWFSASPAANAGDHARAVEIMLEDWDRLQRHAGYLYYLAEQEALAGRADDAIAHLRTAIELRPEFRERARAEEAFADSAFASVVSPG